MIVKKLRLIIDLIILTLLATASTLLFANKSYAATYTVINTADSGAGSLRQAIVDANTNPGADTINFNIAGPGPHTITVGPTELPEITGPTIIDGTSQAGSSCGDLVPATLPSASNTAHNIKIILDGTNITWLDYEQGILHFVAGSSGSEVRGISFVNAGSSSGNYISGISIGDAVIGLVDNVIVECNYFSIMPDGVTQASNYGNNIRVGYDISNISIRNNLVSAAVASGLFFGSSLSTSSVNNVIEENLFGTLANGLTAASNNNVLIELGTADNVNIQRNIIGASNGSAGVFVSSSDNISLQNNYIGLNINQSALNNNGDGLYADNNSNITVSNNRIANSDNGIKTSFVNSANINNNNLYDNFRGADLYGGVTQNFTNNNVYNNAEGIRASSTNIDNNYVYANNGNGIVIINNNSTVRGNYIGIDTTLNPNGNNGNGILLGEYGYSAGDNTIGGNNTTDRNFIADNAENGIRIFNNIEGICDYSNLRSKIINNYIGTNTSGQIQAGFGNGKNGISVNEINNGNSCGGSVYKHIIGNENMASAGNIIAGNNLDGIRIYMVDPSVITTDVFSISILVNSIYGNGNLGINLATDNDNDGIADLDLGPNLLNSYLMSYPALRANYYINAPTIHTANFSGNQVTINYSFQANSITPNPPYLETTDLIGYRLDFYINNPGQDGAYSGYSQGRVHLGSFIVDGSEINATHTFTSPISLSSAQTITATATVLWRNINNTCPSPTKYGDGPPYIPCS